MTEDEKNRLATHRLNAINLVDRHRPREYSLVQSNAGMLLCDKHEGALMCFRFAEDVERLRDLLAAIDVARLPDNGDASHG